LSDPAHDSLFLQLQKENKMKNIFVGISASVLPKMRIEPCFEAYGTVDRVSVVTDRDTGQARGFGFVE